MFFSCRRRHRAEVVMRPSCLFPFRPRIQANPANPVILVNPVCVIFLDKSDVQNRTDHCDRPPKKMGCASWQRETSIDTSVAPLCPT